jgi:ankyrin repeat protein
MKAVGSTCTPLMVAAYKGDMEALVMLLEAKPDVTIKTSYGP